MRISLWLIAVAAAGVGVWHFRSSSAPSVRQIEPLLRDYLVSEASRSCSGTMTLERLDDVSIGDFSTQMGGWPVYAAHVETCRQGGDSTTFDGSKDAERKVASAFARRSAAGGVELYTPAFFQNAQRDMQQTFQKALDSIQPKQASSSARLVTR
jgi:hypothetical protein